MLLACAIHYLKALTDEILVLKIISKWISGDFPNFFANTFQPEMLESKSNLPKICTTT